MSNKLDGVLVAQKINERTMTKIKDLKTYHIDPHLAVVLVGEDPASRLYVSIKEKKCRELGINFSRYNLPENIAEKELLYLIDSLNNDKDIHGIIVQLPLPQHLDTEKIINSIDENKDADALTQHALVDAPTAAAIIGILEEYKIDLLGKNIVIVGYGKLVGKPLEKILKRDYDKLNLTICNSKTKNLSEITKNADIIITAVGKPGLITKNMVKLDSVIIDAGTSETKGKITGDVDYENVKHIASYITPAKGGVGPVTVAKLLENVITLATKHKA